MTLEQILEKVQTDLDLQDLQFIQLSEMIGYVQEAVREAEAEIHKLNLEDQYFLASADLTLVQGEGTLTLPEDIYATKIRAIEYSYGNRQYEIKRFRGTRSFADFMWARTSAAPGSDYRYLIVNQGGTGPRIQLAPLASESGVRGTIWYIRNAAVLENDADECDIPEFINFILQYVKDKCINKERMTPDAPPSPALIRQRDLMVATLTEQVPDGSSGEIEKDLSHYEDSI